MIKYQNWNSIKLNSIKWILIKWNSIKWNSIKWNSIKWNSIKWNSIKCFLLVLFTIIILFLFDALLCLALRQKFVLKRPRFFFLLLTLGKSFVTFQTWFSFQIIKLFILCRSITGFCCLSFCNERGSSPYLTIGLAKTTLKLFLAYFKPQQINCAW